MQYYCHFSDKNQKSVGTKLRRIFHFNTYPFTFCICQEYRLTILLHRLSPFFAVYPNLDGVNLYCESRCRISLHRRQDLETAKHRFSRYIFSKSRTVSTTILPTPTTTYSSLHAEFLQSVFSPIFRLSTLLSISSTTRRAIPIQKLLIWVAVHELSAITTTRKRKL